jgi:hypothetical protein
MQVMTVSESTYYLFRGMTGLSLLESNVLVYIPKSSRLIQDTNDILRPKIVSLSFCWFHSGA